MQFLFYANHQFKNRALDLNNVSPLKLTDQSQVCLNSKKRWTLLEHIGAPDDPSGRHFDLLLEDGQGCRTWRLSTIPLIDGPRVSAQLLPIHKLDWLEKTNAVLSGGRGRVNQVMAGKFRGVLSHNPKDRMHVFLQSPKLEGILEIQDQHCQLKSCEKSPTHLLSNY